MYKQEVIRNVLWYRVISMLWLMVIAIQWTQYTEPIWLEQTTTLVIVTLIVISLIEIPLPLKPPWRWIIKSIAVLAVWRIVLTYYEVYVPQGPLFPDQILGMAQQFTPYIWFSLFAWALFEILLCLLHDRVRILIFLGFNLVAFAILDSFTSTYLWENVAWTVFAGLGWLLSLHFVQFQLTYPQGWKRLLEYPLEMVISIVIIFACIQLIGISMPVVSPILTDPYTAWIKADKRSGGEVGLVTTTGDSTTFSNTITTEDTVSGYSRDDAKLGDGFEFSYNTVMTVDSPVRSYWRGETRRNYTGQGWSDLTGEPRDLEQYAPGGILANGSSGKLETQTVEQTFTMQTDYKYPVIFGSYAIQSVELIDDSEDNEDFGHGVVNLPVNLFWANRESEIHLDTEINENSLMGYPKQYKVVSQVPIIPIAELRSASYESLYSNSTEKDYLQIPSGFPQRVVDLAEEITDVASTPYLKMELLQEYLRENYEYTNEPDVSLKRSKDFVDGFLFEVKEGYCDYYSTAMVMMARSLGVPARWVKGYSSGSLPDYEQMQHLPWQIQQSMGGEYRVTDANAHSWAELYFGEYGWIPFEATSGYSASILTTKDDSEETLAEVLLEEAGKNKQKSGFLSYLGPDIEKAIIAVVVAGILLLGIYRFHAALYFGFLRLRMGRTLTWGDKIIFETQRIMKKLRRRGWSRADHETMRESFQRWTLEQPQLSEPLNLLLLRFEKANYSPDAVTFEEWRSVQDLTRQILKRSSKATH